MALTEAEASRQKRAALRIRVFGHYGRACACCGRADRLTIDHIEGDGEQHRRELFGNSRLAGYRMYYWLVRNGYPKGFQTLCVSCNLSKKNGPACRLDHAKAA